MIAFKVRDMFSGHATDAIIESVKSVDNEAVVHVNLMRHWVEIEPARAQAPELSDAIDKAGFTAEPVGSVDPKIRRALPRISFERPGDESRERRSAHRGGP